MSRYMDFGLIEKYPNKYNLTPDTIKQLKILDWNKLKKHTWHNDAMKDTGNWWCHFEGCNLDGEYDEWDEFWIGFNKDNNQINCNFYAEDGMCSYTFMNFYDCKDIENKYDLHVQVNAIRYLNKLIDAGILGIGE